MRTAVLLSFAALIVLAPATRGQDLDLDVLEAALRNPPATGFLINIVLAGSQAEEAGVVLGDVFVSYGGVATPNLSALLAAKEQCAGMASVELVLVSAGGRRTVRLRPGQIGANGVPAVKGEPVCPLPPATVTKLDFKALESGAWDHWYSVCRDGKTKVGFAHYRLSFTLGKLVLRREIAFDGGEESGLTHFDVTVISDVKPGLSPLATHFLNPLNNRIRLVKRRGEGVYEVTRPGHFTTFEAPGDLPLVPTFLMESLAAFLPREKGACFHFRYLNEAWGEVSLPAAILCVGPEEIDHRGESVTAWRCELREMGTDAATCTYWFHGPGHALRVDCGWPLSTRVTKEEALKNLDPRLVPRSAK